VIVGGFKECGKTIYGRHPIGSLPEVLDPYGNLAGQTLPVFDQHTLQLQVLTAHKQVEMISTIPYRVPC